MLYFGAIGENSLGTGTEEILKAKAEIKEDNIWPPSQSSGLKMMDFI